MGWEETCAVTERAKFVLEVQRGERTVAECCRLAGVSRKTGYKWLARYGEGGLPALEERPHHALGKATPVELYQSSPRPYPTRLPEVQYPAGFTIRRVRNGGDIKWQGTHIYVTNTLIGEPVALYQTDEDMWTLYYGPLELGRLDARCARVEPKTWKSVTHVPG